MNRSTILSAALSLVLIACLVFVLRSCFAARSLSEPMPLPEPSYAPARTPAPLPTFAPLPSPEPIPFAEEHGFRFDAPEQYSIPAVQAASLPDAVCKPVWAKVSAPRIMRSKPNPEGLVTWEIRYTTTVDTGFSMPADAKCEAFCLLMNGYDLFDYETGRMLNSRNSTDLSDERSSSRTTTLPFGSGSITVFTAEKTLCTWDKWEVTEQDGRAIAVGRAEVETLLSVRAPADYHGLVLGLDPVNTPGIPADLFSAKPSIGTANEYWAGNAADWIFLLAEDCVEAVPAEKAAQAA